MIPTLKESYLWKAIEGKNVSVYRRDESMVWRLCYFYRRYTELEDIIGPNGKRMDDINGRACSIEMFFGRDVLQKDGEWEPVRWKSYLEKAEAYQGEIIAKKEVTARFEQKVKRSQDHLVYEEWKSCDLLLQQIFHAFQK